MLVLCPFPGNAIQTLVIICSVDLLVTRLDKTWFISSVSVSWEKIHIVKEGNAFGTAFMPTITYKFNHILNLNLTYMSMNEVQRVPWTKHYLMLCMLLNEYKLWSLICSAVYHVTDPRLINSSQTGLQHSANGYGSIYLLLSTTRVGIVELHHLTLFNTMLLIIFEKFIYLWYNKNKIIISLYVSWFGTIFIDSLLIH